MAKAPETDIAKSSAKAPETVKPTIYLVPEPTATTINVAVSANDANPSLYEVTQKQQIQFKWGDISWLPEIATEAGWPLETHEKLGQIILRESGGCPNRFGGDAVDKDCNITHVTEWNHRSDTGLLQINGVNYNPKRNEFAIACRKLKICTQKPLLDPLNNLKVGYLLYEAAGWGPWDPCTWGKEWAHRCKKDNGGPSKGKP